jgi:hypothetical protein
LRHFDSRLLNALRNSFTSGEEQSAQKQIGSEQILSGASHPFKRHSLRSFAPGAIATSKNEFRIYCGDMRRIALAQRSR